MTEDVHMSCAEHKTAAETLLVEGRRVVAKIGDLDEQRKKFPYHVIDQEDRDEFNDLTRQMDEHGKKAMGIWAQAQVHAILSLKSSGVN